jgi:hypothetical protein
LREDDRSKYCFYKTWSKSLARFQAVRFKLGASGWNIGHQLHLQQRNMILELQLTLFQTAQLELVGMAVRRQHRNDGIEVAVFHVEFNDAALDVLDVGHDGCSKQFCSKRLRGLDGGAGGARRRGGAAPPAAAPVTGRCRPLVFGLQHHGFSVHSLIYAEVAANKDWRWRYGKQGL